MDWKPTLTRTMRSATSDKEDLNRRILQWHRRLKEVEKAINRGGKKQDG